jgi:hypothetical protein
MHRRYHPQGGPRQHRPTAALPPLYQAKAGWPYRSIERLPTRLEDG